MVNTFIEHKDDVEVFKTQVRLAVSLQSFEHLTSFLWLIINLFSLYVYVGLVLFIP